MQPCGSLKCKCDGWRYSTCHQEENDVTEIYNLFYLLIRKSLDMGIKQSQARASLATPNTCLWPAICFHVLSQNNSCFKKWWKENLLYKGKRRTQSEENFLLGYRLLEKSLSLKPLFLFSFLSFIIINLQPFPCYPHSLESFPQIGGDNINLRKNKGRRMAPGVHIVKQGRSIFYLSNLAISKDLFIQQVWRGIELVRHWSGLQRHEVSSTAQFAWKSPLE